MIRGPRALVAAAVTAGAVAVGTTISLSALSTELAGEFDVGPAAAAAPFSTALCVALLAGAATGPIAQRRGARPLLAAGAVLLPAGSAVVAVTSSFPLALLAAGLGVGGGAGCVLVPVLTAVGTGVGRHRATALGVAAAGGPLGTAVLPPAAVWLAERDGPRGALLGLAVVSAVLLAGCAATVHSGPGAASARPGPVRTPGFGRLYLAAVALSGAVFVPLAHLPTYAAAHGLGLPFAAAMLSTLSVSGVAGRLLCGAAAARFGARTGLRAAALGLVVALGLWLVAGADPLLLVAFAVVFGVANGAYVALLPELLVELHGPAGLGARLGLLHTASAVAALVGPTSAAAMTAWTGSPGAAIVVAAGAALVGWSALREASTHPRAAAVPAPTEGGSR
ncbi:MFS transporter [Pseudonocardia humida]|uniref:MFS transporter n=1 Tax=Pseudonocardia humida TaxID=2800819 RepID=A0ABT1AD02_9PSEU|nr:MFS transporter [Pseudonocardia humida]MCO1660878.1 MFS transporter [Pseudonocardia humida]